MPATTSWLVTNGIGMKTSANTYSNSVAVANDGSIYITGSTEGALDGRPYSGSEDIFLTKYNADGSKAWTEIIGTPNADVARSVAVANDGSIYITGSTEGALDGRPYSGSEDIFLTKYNADGSKAWTEIIGTPNADVARSVAVANDGSIYITGYTKGRTFEGKTSYAEPGAFLTKLNSSGKKQWSQLLGGSTPNDAYAVATADDGAVYITGYNYAGNIDGQKMIGNYDVFLAKYNNQGSKNWTRLWGSVGAEESRAMAISKGGEIYVTGWIQNNVNGFFLTKFDRSGNTLWSDIKDTYGYPLEDGVGVSMANDGSIYLTGSDNNGNIITGEILYAGSGAFLAKMIDTQQNQSPQESQESYSQSLSGVTGKADVLVFSEAPSYGAGQADVITNFRPEEGDTLSIETGLFAGASGTPRLKIAKNTKVVKKLSRSTTDFIYDKSSGCLYFNENGKGNGFGDGGVFAIIDGKISIQPANVSFI
jgi:uncharacterized delta-60 repeat protein